MVARSVTDSEPSAETWTFHNGRWQELHPDHVPWVWDVEGPAFDPTSEKLVFGNTHGPHIDCGTDPRCKPYAVPAVMWGWNGSDWGKLLSSPRLPFYYGDLFSTPTGLMVTGNNWQYQWNGSQWDGGQALPWPEWLQRVGKAVAYDAATRTVLLYGGREWGRNHLYGDLLSWDGRKWRTLAGAPSLPILTPLPSCNFSEAMAGEDFGPDLFAISFSDPPRGPCHLAVTVQFTLLGKDGTRLQIPGNPSSVSLDKDLTAEARTTRVRFTISGSCRLVEGEFGRFSIGDWQLSQPVFPNPPCNGVSAQPLSITSSVETINV